MCRGMTHFWRLLPSGNHLMGENKPLVIKQLFSKFIYIWFEFVDKNRWTLSLFWDHSISLLSETKGGQKERNGIPTILFTFSEPQEYRSEGIKTRWTKWVSSSKVRHGRLKSTFSKSQSGPEAGHHSLANLLIIMLFSFIPVTLALRL